MHNTYSAGVVTAYGAAKKAGYTGTYEEFCAEQAQFAQNAQQVREDKESVEQTVETFEETTVPAAVQAVTDEGTTQIGNVSAEGTTQVGNVNAAGTTQVGNVNQAGSTQVAAVNQAGATQIQAVEDKGDEVIESIPQDYSELTAEVDNLKNAIANSGEVEVDKTLNWINGYVNTSGVVKASSQSATCVVKMRAGETVTIGTANSNITIIGTTQNDSVAVGDTVTIIQKTSSSGAYETYSYKTPTDANIVLCVLKSNYELSFTAPTYIQNELYDLSKKTLTQTNTFEVIKQYAVTPGQSILVSKTKVSVNCPAGDVIVISVSDPDDTIANYLIYLNGQTDSITRLANTKYTIAATETVTSVGIYIDSSRVLASGTITVDIAHGVINTDSIESKVDGMSDYVPTGIASGYVLAHPIANGTFDESGNLVYRSNLIRTAFISFTVNDKITIINDGLEHAVGMWAGTPSSSTIIRNDNSWISTDETIETSTDGYIIIVFRKPDNSEIAVSEFTGEIQLYNTLAYHLSIGDRVDSIPAYYLADDYLLTKAARINALGKTGDDVFAFITDIHWELNAKHSPDLISYLGKNCVIPKVFNGGDVADSSLLPAYKKYRGAIDGKVYHIAGNHDWFTPTNGKDLYYCMDSANNDQIGNPFMHYYYVDNVQQKIRYIVLNSFSREEGTSTITVGYDTEQIAWFSSDALNLPGSEWDVIVFTHFLRTTSLITTGASIENAIDAFNADSSHEGKILAVIQGHTHWDGIYHTSGGVPVITTTCDKWDLSNESSLIPPEGIAYREFGTIKEQAFDVMILNREAKTITAVRIGAPAQNNIDVYRTDPNFTWIGTQEERVVSYA